MSLDGLWLLIYRKSVTRSSIDCRSPHNASFRRHDRDVEMNLALWNAAHIFHACDKLNSDSCTSVTFRRAHRRDGLLAVIRLRLIRGRADVEQLALLCSGFAARLRSHPRAGIAVRFTEVNCT
jgi:hypothetical protein